MTVYQKLQGSSKRVQKSNFSEKSLTSFARNYNIPLCARSTVILRAQNLFLHFFFLLSYPKFRDNNNSKSTMEVRLYFYCSKYCRAQELLPRFKRMQCRKQALCRKISIAKSCAHGKLHWMEIILSKIVFCCCFYISTYSNL